MFNTLSHDEQPIIAQCTPRGAGALALIRISGIGSVDIASRLCVLAGPKLLHEQESHTIHYGFIRDELGQKLDQVMVLLTRAPRTFTGQDTVEITCHNNQFIIEAIIELACRHGVRLAQEGEFAKRAVINGKIDLIQAEAINEVIRANTQVALKKSLATLQGNLSHCLVQIERDLFKAFALSESSFEFIDEDMQFGIQIAEIIESTCATISTVSKNYHQQQQIRQGVKIALIGSVNAGKSSLFNALLNTERAIVTPIAGTTRDSIEAGLYKNGTYWTLIDTAGLRETEDIIEQEGIERSLKQAHQADIMLLVIDSSRDMTSEEAETYTKILSEYAKKVIVVYTKNDLLPLLKEKYDHEFIIQVSNTAQHTIDELENLIQQKVTSLFSSFESPFLLNQRQYTLLCEVERKLQAIGPLLKEDVQYELVSYHLKDALESLAQVTGKSVTEKGMDTIFKEFCIGK